MKIKDLLDKKSVTVSCEIFPPKKLVSYEPVRTTMAAIAALRPDFMSVTYGAGGSTEAYTVQIAEELENELGVTALAHLTCVSSTKSDIEALLQKLRDKNIENVLALRGDVPADGFSPQHYRYAYELVYQIKKQYGDFCIGAACYPEGHVEAEHKEKDIDYLKLKVDSGVDFLTTQMFFDNNVLYNFLYRILAKGVKVPVIAGVMPVTNAKQIRRITELSGTALPPRFKAIIDRFGEHPLAMQQAGIAYATEQIIDLIANGVKGIHIYTMNNPGVATSIFNNLSHILRDGV
ncbi:MAG: methylenetetrahydrofolate reductase [NAD(P)H] [Bacillota bacterium]